MVPSRKRRRLRFGSYWAGSRRSPVHYSPLRGLTLFWLRSIALGNTLSTFRDVRERVGAGALFVLVCAVFLYAGYGRVFGDRRMDRGRAGAEAARSLATGRASSDTGVADAHPGAQSEVAAEPLAVVLRTGGTVGEQTTAQPVAPATGLLQVPNRQQERNLNCEFRSATDLAAYYGHDFPWDALFAVVGFDPTGNPYKGFAGRSMDDPPGSVYPNGYGVYAEPVAKGLRAMGIAARAHEGQTVAWLRQRVDGGHPVVVWATAKMKPRPAVTWRTTDGIVVRGVKFEHTFTVVAYNDAGVWVNDPYTATTDHYSWARFEEAWASLGNMALTIEEEAP